RALAPSSAVIGPASVARKSLRLSGAAPIVSIIASLPEPRDRGAKFLADLILARVMAVLDDLFAGDEDVLHALIAAGENPRVEHIIARSSDERGVVCVEHDDIGSHAEGKRADRLRHRLGSALECGVIKRAPGRA